MSNIRVVVKPAGIRELLRSPGVLADLKGRAEAIATAAGPGHRVEAEAGRTRARAAVITDTPKAMVAEATKRTLTRAVDAGRR